MGSVHQYSSSYFFRKIDGQHPKLSMFGDDFGREEDPFPSESIEQTLLSSGRSPGEPEWPLRLLIVGHNPSEKAWELGHYYANPSNKMWKLLTAAGIVPTGFTASDDDKCPITSGVGFTDLVRCPLQVVGPRHAPSLLSR